MTAHHGSSTRYENRCIRKNQIDELISAEIPDKNYDPDLFDIVTKHMLHHCKTCLDEDGKCIKKFPKPFMKETETNKNGYPLYKRRSPEDGG